MNRKGRLLAIDSAPPRTAKAFKAPPRFSRRLPIGAEPVEGGGAHFRVWAPKCNRLAIELTPNPKLGLGEKKTVELAQEESGYFSGFVPEARVGMLYKVRTSEGSFPDPASRYQPEGPHGPSQIIDSSGFDWSDQEWRGLARSGQVLYELHIGTFTREGTWSAAAAELPELKRLGITAVELMPVADFAGRFGWGYDGVNLFAPTRLYGAPDDFRSFINQAHRLGLGVILDVVYNHVGPDGNYLKQFSEDYFTCRHSNEWGEAINFDGENSRPVREFFVSNARYWIEEFHLDGLRLDAVHQIFDASADHILAAITRAVREAAWARGTFISAENETQWSRLAQPVAEGGFGLDILWNDDFHHSARVALTGCNEAYYSGYQGSPQEFISAVKWGFLYQGQWYDWQRKRRGSPTRGLRPEQFLIFLENHDQVANSLRGLRLHQMTDPNQLRAMTTLLLLAPGTPMLFQGQEFASSAPFLFFADHHPQLARLVAKGRREFLRQFASIANPQSELLLQDPAAVQTYQSCKLDFSERQSHRSIYEFHCALLQLRRQDPVFSKAAEVSIEGAVLGPQAFVLRFFDPGAGDRLVLVNLGLELVLRSSPEPLLAPCEGHWWELMWSSEDPRFGGRGTAVVAAEDHWHLPAHAAVVLRPVQPAGREERKDGQADPSNRSDASAA